jgi:hypothetical protein
MHTNEQMNTIIDVMYSKLELNLTSSFFSMHSTTEILFDGVDLIYSRSARKRKASSLPYSTVVAASRKKTYIFCSRDYS